MVTVEDVDRLVGGGDGDAGAAVMGAAMQARTFDEFRQVAERAFLLAKLREYDWNVSETARGLEMPRSNLYKKMERYGLSREGAD
jgi:two-component system nitrogen regulation response regulator NtrX